MSEATTESGPNPLPIWLSIPIILLCLAGGGWIIHWYVVSDPISHDVKVLTDAAKPVAQPMRLPVGQGGPANPGGWTCWFGGGVNGRNRPNGTPHVIARDAQNDRWEVKTNTATATTFKDKQGALNVRISYNNDSFLPQDIRKTLATTSSLVKTHAAALNLVDTEKNKLQRLSNTTEMTATPADRDMLKQEITNYVQAADAQKPVVEQKLYTLLDEVAQRSLAPSIQTATEHVKEIDQIITPEMWQQNTVPNATGK